MDLCVSHDFDWDMPMMDQGQANFPPLEDKEVPQTPELQALDLQEFCICTESIRLPFRATSQEQAMALCC